ncbi:MAG: hypothetical protein J6T82_05540 [Bacteroidaceae bacterium]|nr:hypothetical protein [Bacteroidaceae bacterium]
MKTKFQNQKFIRVLMIFTFLVGSFGANAQALWDWDDCVDWVKYEGGGDYLAHFARLLYAEEGFEFRVTQTSPDIVVAITYQPITMFGSPTTCRYKIVRGNYRGAPYFKDVEVLYDPLFNGPFNSWNSIQQYSVPYKMGDFDMFYGVNDLDDLPVHKKAAAALMIEFVDYYVD